MVPVLQSHQDPPERDGSEILHDGIGPSRYALLPFMGKEVMCILMNDLHR